MIFNYVHSYTHTKTSTIGPIYQGLSPRNTINTMFSVVRHKATDKKHQLR